MKAPLWTMALRNLARRPRRTLLSVTAIALAALTMVALYGMMAGLQADLAANIQRYVTGQVLVEDGRIAQAVGQTLPLALFDASDVARTLSQVSGVDGVSPRVTTAASVFVDGDAVYFPVMGLEFDSDPLQPGDFLIPGGRLPSSDREAVVSVGLAHKLGLAVGDKVTAVTQTLRGSSNGMTFTVTGIVSPVLESFRVPWLFTSLATAQRFAKLGDAATGLLVTTRPNVAPATVATALDRSLKERGLTTVTARTWDTTSTMYGYISLMRWVFVFIGVLFFGLASTVIINTLLMVILERSKEIGMLGALGMDTRQIRDLFLAESALMSGLGALVGVVVGSVMVVVLQITGIDYTEALKGVSIDVNPVLHTRFEWWMPVAVFVSALGVTTLFTLLPVNRVRRMAIVDALKGEL